MQEKRKVQARSTKAPAPAATTPRARLTAAGRRELHAASGCALRTIARWAAGEVVQPVSRDRIEKVAPKCRGVELLGV